MTNLIPRTETDALLQEYANTAESLAEQVPIEITTDSELQVAEINMKAIKSLAKQIETKRKEITRPIDDLKKEVKRQFDIPIARLADVTARFKTVVTPYLRLREEEIREAALERARLDREAVELRNKEQARLEKIAEEKEQGSILSRVEAKQIREKAKHLQPAPVESPVVADVVHIDKRMFKKKYRAEVIDPTAVPLEYWIIDQKKLDTLARTNKGQNPPGGVVFVEVE